MSLRVLFILLLAVSSGCFAPMPPPEVRYFEPLSDAAGVAADAAANNTRAALPLRLRRVRAAAHLKDRMVWRDSDVEFGFSEGRRWAEMPATYLERALAEALFTPGDLVRTDSTAAPMVEVELRAFEEWRTGSLRADVEFAVLLYDEQQRAVLERMFRAERPLDGGSPEEIAAGMGRALDAAVADAVAAIRNSLGR